MTWISYGRLAVLKQLCLCVASFSLLTGCTSVYQASIEHSDFVLISPNTYADPALSEQQTSQVLELIQQAKRRIENRFGPLTVKPVIIITGTSENAAKYGLGVFPGTAFIAPWNISLVLDQTQIDSPDVIAHELMHAQVAHMLGYRKFMLELPTWLSEGIAMQVDEREQYEIDFEQFDPQEIARIKQVESNADFWTDSKEGDIRNYRAAKAAVHQILQSESDLTGLSLYERLALVQKGASFAEMF
ncbi:MAG: hypothetical protein ACPGYX_01140 [Oceanobacter sp.]